MPDETETGSAGAPDGGRHSPGGGGLSSPLQARAAFIKNWGWQSVVSINRGACERGRAQHGINSETGKACADDWEKQKSIVLSLQETFDFLKSFHRRAPFLFFNGNTFATIGRETSFALFSDLPAVRRREVASAVAHYIAGVLDRESMVQIVETLSEISEMKPGDRVKTLRGSTHGKFCTSSKMAVSSGGQTEVILNCAHSLNRCCAKSRKVRDWVGLNSVNPVNSVHPSLTSRAWILC